MFLTSCLEMSLAPVPSHFCEWAGRKGTCLCQAPLPSTVPLGRNELPYTTSSARFAQKFLLWGVSLCAPNCSEAMNDWSAEWQTDAKGAMARRQHGHRTQTWENRGRLFTNFYIPFTHTLQCDRARVWKASLTNKLCQSSELPRVVQVLAASNPESVKKNARLQHLTTQKLNLRFLEKLAVVMELWWYNVGYRNYTDVSRGCLWLWHPFAGLGGTPCGSQYPLMFRNSCRFSITSADCQLPLSRLSDHTCWKEINKIHLCAS